MSVQRVVVCGAGIAGLTLAWWLEREGRDVLLVERAPAPRDTGYLIDFLGAGFDVAERMGILPRLRNVASPTTVVTYQDPAGRSRGWFDYHEFADAIGGRALTLARGDLERVLREALGDRVRYGTTVDHVSEEDGAVRVGLSDGTVERADLLVGADGIHSRVRKLVFGEERLRYVGFHTASYLCSDPVLSQRIGDRFVLVTAPGRQAGLYPMPDGRLGVWLTRRSQDQTPAADLPAAYAGMGDLVDQALRHCPDGRELYHDLVAQIELNGWSRGRVVLVGDACQAVSLLAGQGASMAMAGAYVLAEEIGHGDLARYERRLRPSVRATQRYGRRTANWLVPDSDWRIRARAWAFAATRLPGGARLTRAALAGVETVAVDRGRLGGPAA